MPVILLYTRRPGALFILLLLPLLFLWSLFFEKEPDIPSVEEQERLRRERAE
ncbi:hypothetical protein [Flaviaesturariibacter flavus]|uniref:hypothetical protein n=1 Tax=Flaviaesturariibacter flavus TaxID=2502780 RepID=UPI0014053C24|nr:hypothetical protein [Flaviaesturariibacter flavus]